MVEEILGSKERADNAFGQNGYQGPRKLGGGEPKTKPNIMDGLTAPDAAAIVAARGGGAGGAGKSADDDASRLAQIKGHPIAAHAGMRSRSDEYVVISPKIDHAK
jgi:hypothetical protein